MYTWRLSGSSCNHIHSYCCCCVFWVFFAFLLLIPPFCFIFKLVASWPLYYILETNHMAIPVREEWRASLHNRLPGCCTASGWVQWKRSPSIINRVSVTAHCPVLDFVWHFLVNSALSTLPSGPIYFFFVDAPNNPGW